MGTFQNSSSEDKKPPPNTSINEVYELSLKFLDQQRAIITSLDARTATYIGLFGIAVTILISFGGLLLEKIRNLQGVPVLSYAVQIFSILYVAAVASLSLALYSALKSYHYARVPELEKKDTWRRKIAIKLLQKLVGKEIRVKPEVGALDTWTEDKPEDFKSVWIRHFLQVHNANEKILDKRADFLNSSYVYTLFAMVMLLALVFLMAVYVSVN